MKLKDYEKEQVELTNELKFLKQESERKSAELIKMESMFKEYG